VPFITNNRYQNCASVDQNQNRQTETSAAIDLDKRQVYCHPDLQGELCHQKPVIAAARAGGMQACAMQASVKQTLL